MGTEITEIRIGQLEGMAGTQPRVNTDHDTIVEYAEAMERGDKFPPIVVFFDGEKYYLADGFHRVSAALGLLKKLPAEIHRGTLRDAILYSVGANAEHGLRRTNADKRMAVMRLLEDEEWGKWSDSEIARRCKVNHKTVAKCRRELSLTWDFPSEDNKVERTYTTKHGTAATMNTDNIGKRPAVESSPPTKDEVPPPKDYAPQHTTATPYRDPATFEQTTQPPRIAPAPQPAPRKTSWLRALVNRLQRWGDQEPPFEEFLDDLWESLTEEQRAIAARRFTQK